jgi:hypothetical protein
MSHLIDYAKGTCEIQVTGTGEEVIVRVGLRGNAPSHLLTLTPFEADLLAKSLRDCVWNNRLAQDQREQGQQ